MTEPWWICFFACNREMQPFSFFFLLAISWGGGGISGRVRGSKFNCAARPGFGLQVLSPCRPLVPGLTILQCVVFQTKQRRYHLEWHVSLKWLSFWLMVTRSNPTLLVRMLRWVCADLEQRKNHWSREWCCWRAREQSFRNRPIREHCR